jgi:tRNA A-37 threonylcarbamoyl transferase component Bud32
VRETYGHHARRATKRETESSPHKGAEAFSRTPRTFARYSLGLMLRLPSPESGPVADESGDVPNTSQVTGGDGAQSSKSPVLWKGTDRYEILNSLGEGGMGFVYEAYDRHRKERIAIKTMRSVDAAALYRFKQEFRTLADVRHPNLVQLYELFAEDEENLFFSMELVEGSDFIAYVRNSAVVQQSGMAPRGRFAAVDFVRLRSALIQLVDGIAALHAAGKLHRDVKPSNVRVTPDGRVVILDFGVATELGGGQRAEGAEEDEGMIGTAAYMAPEQAAGEASDLASDWYSVGVMLYEAIVGEPPHVGSPFEIVANKCQIESLPPSARVDGVPADLEALCLELLAIDAKRRPTGEQLLNRLRADAPTVSSSRLQAAPALMELVGREAHLARLQEASDATQVGKAVCVRIFGAAGMGKSELAHSFLHRLENSANTIILRGRTYERESVPYKAFDALIDQLTHCLLDLEARGESPALPADIGALAQVFPVLRRVSSIDMAAQSKADDPRAVRLRAFAALRELFTTLTTRGPLVVFIDDVHWGDADSAALLLELVRPPNEPPVLFLTTHRTEDADTSAFLLALAAQWPDDVEVREVEVGPLQRDDANCLALALLERDDAVAERVAEKVAHESRGNPFLIVELARFALTGSNQRTLQGLSLEQMVEERTGRLSDEARHLLELIAIGGRPMPWNLVKDAASGVHGASQLVALLQANRFVRVSLRDGVEWVEVVHDRMRESLLVQVSAKVARNYHADLARALELSPEPDQEAIATHLIGAGDRERGGQYARRAADLAISQLAFAQAERLYQLALEALPADSGDAQSLRISLAKASEWAGNAEKAARGYLVAAAHAPDGARLELERAAAAQLIAAGHVDEGVSVFRKILATHRIRVPSSRAGVRFWTFVYRVAAALLLRLTLRDKNDLTPDRKRYLDALQTMGRVLAVVDPDSAIYMKARYFCEALWSRSPSFVLRAAILEAGSFSAAGNRASRKERALFALGKRLAEQTGDEEWLGYHDLTYGIGEYLRGRWRSCVELLDKAQVRLAAFRAWQANASIYRIYAMVSLGDLVEVKTRAKALVDDARRRGDRYTAANLLASHPTAARLAADDVRSAQREVKEALAHWSQATYLVQHWQGMLWETETFLYAGDGEQAWQRLARDESRLLNSSLMGIQLIRAWTLFARARSSVASLAMLDSSQQRARLREARRAQRQLQREAMPWIDVLAGLARAAIAHASLDDSASEQALKRAASLADIAEMPLHAAAARHRLGLLLGGETGQAMVTSAEDAMAKRGVRVPARYAQMLVVGQWLPRGH